jgi:hypothetical protein
MQPVQWGRGDLQNKLTGKPDGKNLFARTKRECQGKEYIKFKGKWRALDKDKAEQRPRLKNVTIKRMTYFEDLSN